MNDFLVNHSSCLRDEYKKLSRFRISLRGLKTSLEMDLEKASEIEGPHKSREQRKAIKKKYPEGYLTHLKRDIAYTREYIRKIEEEIANFPPYPELPPTKPLVKISGVLEQVQFIKAIGYFEHSEYSTEKEAAERKIERDNKGAILLFMVQALAGTTVVTPFNDGRKKEYKCLYVTGLLSGKKFSGWLNKTNIQLGDRLEMAVMPDGDEYRLYAVANPQQGTLSLIPNCAMGSEYYTLKNTTRAIATIWFFLTLPFVIFALPNAKEWMEIITFYLAAVAITSPLAYRQLIKENRATSGLFDRIGEALSIAQYKKISLYYYTRRKVKEMKAKGEWNAPDKSSVSMPQSDVNSIDDAFYYYPTSGDDN